MVSLAEKCDSAALSVFGTNLLYGGLMTSTLNNSPRCRFADYTSKLTQNDISALQNAIKSDLKEGRRICIIRGSSLLSDNLINLYRYFSDTAFILIDKEASRPINYGIYNVLYISESNKDITSMTPNSPLLYGIVNLLSGNFDTKSINACDISSLFSFLSAPSLPIRCNSSDFYNAVCQIENLLSEGKNRTPIIHPTN